MIQIRADANIRNAATHWWKRLCLCSSVFICACISMLAQANPVLPEPVQKDLPGLAIVGDTSFRFIGMKVYDIRLWAPEGRYAADQPFALELVYDMNFKGADIAKRSIDEKRGQGYGPEEKLNRWYGEMARIFPDIKPGDTLIGIHVPGKEARFYTRSKFIAIVADPEFARAFFDIWLSEKTSQPGLRKRLLGNK
ncbi:MAG: chalcone isomerase family protein [Betaproteobacteria bacterium]|nr:chalcone isomerase family protein [Betaproteobacteria bacterium]